MGRASVLTPQPKTRASLRGWGAILLLGALLCAAPTSPGGETSESAVDTFPVRMVKLGGDPGDPRTREHLEFCLSLGFNAVWVYSHQAGRWTERSAENGPYLSSDFVDLARWCHERGLRVFVSVNPVADSANRFVFHERSGEKRIRKFFRLLRRRAGIRDFVLSFDDQPTELSELSDIVRYGRSSAPAHLDLTRRVYRKFRRGETYWLCAAAYCDSHLADATGLYSRPFLNLLPTLPGEIGIVWTGPTVLSPSITAADLAVTRERLGERKLLLYDNYPVNGNGSGRALGLILGPLRNRGPRLHEQSSIYLSCPMTELGGSRLALLTVADYLRNPAVYDPDASARRAMERMAGGDESALRALDTQVLEWGGWIGTRNYRFQDKDNVRLVAEALDDPAALVRFTYVAKRYPERMAALESLADPVFREDLLTRMASRLAVAKAIPPVREYRARIRAGRKDVAPILASLKKIRGSLDEGSEAERLFDLFMRESGVPLSGVRP